jgi:hypothetical protein
VSLLFDRQAARRDLMAATDRRTLDEVARLGAEVYDRKVRPMLRPEDDFKFVAIDVESEEFEFDPDDYTAVMRLLARLPEADIWLERVGQPAAIKMGWRGSFGAS